jgi:alkyl hydroperoxide reductase subunit F
MEYELIIIGGGPAGTSAAVYAARKQLKTLLIAEEFGGQSVVSETIYNWIGTPEIGGNELAESFKQHIKYYEGEYLKLETGALVTGVEKTDGGFIVTTNRDETFTTKTVLVSSGSGRRKLNVPGAAEFDNKGVVYCASCDGPLFSGQDVAVIGGGNAGFESASQLAQYCKSVTILHRSDEYKAEQITVEKILARNNVTGILNANTTEILGDKFVSGLKYADANGNEQQLDVTGIFVEIGQIPNTGFIEGVVEFDDLKRIKIDPWTQRSSVEGIWAAGDCSNVKYHQNNIAAGDAVRALEDIYNYLHA